MCVGEKVIEKAEEIFKSIGRFFFLPFFMAPCHNGTSQSRTYRFFFLGILHATIIIIPKLFLFFASPETARLNQGERCARLVAIVRQVGEKREREFDSMKRAILHAESA